MAFTSQVTEGFIQVGTDKIRYYESAPDEAGRETIVLLHGTGGSAQNNFWALFPMLAKGHRVITFDFVDSSKEEAARDHYALQAQGIIKALNSGPVHLVGCSLGAVIAGQVAGDAPELVKTLTLIAGWIKTDLQQMLRNDVWLTLHKENSAALPGFMAMTAFSQAFLLSKLPSEIDALLEGLKNGPDRYKKMTFNRSIDITEQIAKITAPTLIIGCTYDQMVPIRHSKLLFGAIANSRFAEVPSGHAVTTERPSQLLMLIRDFVRAPESNAAGTIYKPVHA